MKAVPLLLALTLLGEAPSYAFFSYVAPPPAEKRKPAGVEAEARDKDAAGGAKEILPGGTLKQVLSEVVPPTWWLYRGTDVDLSAEVPALAHLKEWKSVVRTAVSLADHEPPLMVQFAADPKGGAKHTVTVATRNTNGTMRSNERVAVGKGANRSAEETSGTRPAADSPTGAPHEARKIDPPPASAAPPARLRFAVQDGSFRDNLRRLAAEQGWREVWEGNDFRVLGGLRFHGIHRLPRR